MSRRSLLTVGKRLFPKLSLQSSTTASDQVALLNKISFELSEEQIQLRTTARQFAQEKLIPNAAHYDQTGEFPRSIMEEAHEAGLMNCTLPQQYGGLELDRISSVILYENLAYGCAGCTLPMAINEFAYTPIMIAGTEEQKKKYLTLMASEPVMASFAVTEPGNGSDVAGLKTRCIKDGNDYIINGSKMWISNGGHAKFYFVLARSDPDLKTPTSKAFTAFIIDADTPGVIKGKKENMMGQRASDTRGITFEDVRVPASSVVGRPGEGFVVAMKAFDESRPVIAALANGIAARCLDEATNYAVERKAFGKPIIENQGVSFMLADMAMNLELSRLITFKCAYEVMNGSPDSYFSSIAKCFAADTANLAATNAVQIFGGNGYCRDYPVEKLMRDAKILQIYEGTSQIQRLIISRRIVNRLKQTGSASLTY